MLVNYPGLNYVNKYFNNILLENFMISLMVVVFVLGSVGHGYTSGVRMDWRLKWWD